MSETEIGAPRSALLMRLRDEKDAGVRGGVYHRLQVEMTYNSNHIEGSQLSEEQTRLIFETATVGGEGLRSMTLSRRGTTSALSIASSNAPELLSARNM